MDALIRAAGGLVWKQGNEGPLVALVRRARHDDWSLPKGKAEPGETWLATAVREASEETGVTVEPRRVAGTSVYRHGARRKLVLFWHMAAGDSLGTRDEAEVQAVAWLRPKDAIARLSYVAEKALVAQHAEGPPWVAPPTPARAPRGSGPRRLSAAVESMRAEVEQAAVLVEDEVRLSWHWSALRALELARAHALRGELDHGWRQVHLAERDWVMGMDASQIEARGQQLAAESDQKLTGWRHEAVHTALSELEGPLRGVKASAAGLVAAEAQRVRDAERVRASLKILQDKFANMYHSVALTREQIGRIMTVMGLTLAALLAMALVDERNPNQDLFPMGATPVSDGIAMMTAMVLMGILGGSVSAATSTVGAWRKKMIPEQVASLPATLARIFTGGAAAFIVFLMATADSGFFDVRSSSQLLILGAAAGFSERLVSKALGSVGAQNGK